MAPIQTPWHQYEALLQFMVLGLFGSPGLNNQHMVRLETQVSQTRSPQEQTVIVETQVSTGRHSRQKFSLIGD